MYFLPGKPRHPGPFYYYVPILMGGFAQWSIFLPAAFICGFRRVRKALGTEVLFLGIWFCSIFLFFSVASSKLGTYLLPLFPAASMFVAILWWDLFRLRTGEMRRLFFFSYAPVTAIALAGMGYLALFPLPSLEAEWWIDSIPGKKLVLFTSVCLVLSFLAFWKGHYRVFFSSLAGTVVCTLFAILLFILPIIDPYLSTKQLTSHIDRLLPPGEKIVFFYRLRESSLFYTNRKAYLFTTPAELACYLGFEERVFCIASKKRLNRHERLRSLSYVLAEEGDKVLILNRPPL
jgi:hypothetical protein